MLSLFGYDATGDYHRIVNEMVGRRVNLAIPEQSLLLKKATEFLQMIGDDTQDVAVYADILWGLFNSTEFAFIH